MFTQCGGRSSAQLRVDFPGAPPVIAALDRPFLVVGSDAKCDLRLDHADVAPRHCVLQWVDGKMFCSDLSQLSGLFSDRNSRLGGRWLAEGPVIVGPYRLSLDVPEEGDVSEYSPLDRSTELMLESPRLGLQLEGVEQRENQYHVDRMLTMVGRGAQCKLRLHSKKIANVQACILRIAGECWLINLVGSDTTCVNGKSIAVSPIHIGDKLQLGPFGVRVVQLPDLSAEEIAARKIAAEMGPTLPPAVKSHSPSNGVISTSIVPELVTVSADRVLITANGTNGSDETLADFLLQERVEVAEMKMRLKKLEEFYCAIAREFASKRKRQSSDRKIVQSISSQTAILKSGGATTQVIRGRARRSVLNVAVDDENGSHSRSVVSHEAVGSQTLSRLGIFFDCRNCERELRIHGKYLGHFVECIFCSAGFCLEPHSHEVTNADSFSRCPYCARALRYPSTLIGSTIPCSFCRGRLQILNEFELIAESLLQPDV